MQALLTADASVHCYTKLYKFRAQIIHLFQTIKDALSITIQVIMQWSKDNFKVHIKGHYNYLG